MRSHTHNKKESGLDIVNDIEISQLSEHLLNRFWTNPNINRQ